MGPRTKFGEGKEAILRYANPLPSVLLRQAVQRRLFNVGMRLVTVPTRNNMAVLFLISVRCKLDMTSITPQKPLMGRCGWTSVEFLSRRITTRRAVVTAFISLTWHF